MTVGATEREVLRDALLESLRRAQPVQFVTLKENTAEVLASRTLPVDVALPGRRDQLRGIDERRFRELVWSLINDGILVQGMDANNDEWPFLSVTEMGEDYLENPTPDVYDPDGYLRDVARSTNLDDVERRFLGQAIGAFRADLPDASVVMLGACAEHVVWKIADEVGAKDALVAAKVGKLATQSALTTLEFVQKYFEDRKNRLSRPLKDELSTTFSGVATMIRVSRNGAGHPGLGAADREQALVLLRLFPRFREWAYKVMGELPLT